MYTDTGTPKLDLDEALNLLSRKDKNDYIIAPIEHAELYATAIPQLAEILQMGSIKVLAKAFEDSDRKALKHQSNYFRYAKWASFLVAITAVLGALTAAVLGLSKEVGQILSSITIFGLADSKEETLGSFVVLILSVLAAISAAAAAFLLNLLHNGAYLRRWMQARAKAETERLAYFSLVTDPAKTPVRLAGSGQMEERALSLVRFWYFLKYQYWVQADYYKERGSKHENSSEFSMTIAAAAAALGMIAALLIPVMQNWIGSWAALFGVVTVLGTTLSTYAATREAMTQDQRNAERYERTAGILTKIGGRIDDVEAAIEAGTTDVLTDFVDAVHEQLSVEHRQWLDSADAASGAVKKLNDALSAVAPKPK